MALLCPPSVDVEVLAMGFVYPFGLLRDRQPVGVLVGGAHTLDLGHLDGFQPMAKVVA
jgi:hypothetical protein